jgi:adenine-specific DNA-methyltransferase
MVQLPYPVEAGSAASRLGLRTIADIGKERIRRVILHAHGRREEVAAEVPADAAMRRVGLRVFRLSASNFRPWQVPSGVSPEAYSKQLGAFVDPLAAGWSEESLLWEVVLKEGLGLTTAIQRDTRSGPVVVYQATDPGVGQSVYVCLENRVRLEDLRPLELDDRATFICRDVALDDGTAANLALQARLKVI